MKSFQSLNIIFANYIITPIEYFNMKVRKYYISFFVTELFIWNTSNLTLLCGRHWQCTPKWNTHMLCSSIQSICASLKLQLPIYSRIWCLLLLKQSNKSVYSWLGSQLYFGLINQFLSSSACTQQKRMLSSVPLWFFIFPTYKSYNNILQSVAVPHRTLGIRILAWYNTYLLSKYDLITGNITTSFSVSLSYCYIYICTYTSLLKLTSIITPLNIAAVII